MELTVRQREIFSFIRAFIKERGYPPLVREIGDHFHIYPRAAFDHLKALERKGYLKRRSSMSRGLETLVFEENRLRKGSRPLIRDIAVLGRVAAGKPTLAVEHVGLGTDGGGHLSRFIEGYRGVRDLVHLVKAMEEVGFPNDEIAAYMGGNFYRILRSCIG